MKGGEKMEEDEKPTEGTQEPEPSQPNYLSALQNGGLWTVHPWIEEGEALKDEESRRGGPWRVGKGAC